MAEIVGPPANVIRNRPITTELRELLDGSADATGVEKVVIVSGGQTSNHAPIWRVSSAAGPDRAGTTTAGRPTSSSSGTETR